MPREPHVDSYFAATANDQPEYPELAGEVRADVCVIGGGYTGLSTAICLAERGYDVAVLEARRVGWGASGRNGGQVCTGFSAGMDGVRKALGEADTKTVFDITEEAKVLLRDRVERHKDRLRSALGIFPRGGQEKSIGRTGGFARDAGAELRL